MRTSSQRPLPTTISALAALTLTLSACGGDNGDVAENTDGNGTDNEQVVEEQSENVDVYEFEQAKTGNHSSSQPFRTPAGHQVNIWLSDELAATVPEEMPVLVDNYVITGTRVFDSTNVCVLDVEIGYSDGGLETLLEIHGEEGIPSALFSTGLTETVESLPTDEEIVETGVYMASDYSEASIVDDCEDDRFTQFQFPDSNDNIFARITRVTAHADGSVAFNQANVRGADVAANGDWIVRENWGQSSQEDDE